MKTYLPSLILGIALLTGLVCVAADTPSSPTVGDNLKAAGTNISDAARKIGTQIKDGSVTAALEVKTGAVWVASEVKTGAVKVATAVKEGTGTAVDRSVHSPQELIDQARGQMVDGRYRDALDTLDRLSHFKLTDDQQKMADSLRAQIAKAFHDASPGTPATTSGQK